MKTILTTALAMLVAMTFVGCTGGYSHSSIFIYKNNSSREIVVKTYTYTYANDYYTEGYYTEEQEFSFRIPVGESHTLSFNSEVGYTYPFYRWTDKGPEETDSLNVSNGQKQFGYTRYSSTNDNLLFQEVNYEIIKTDKKNRDRTYLYVFTDKDFENATPIEQ